MADFDELRRRISIDQVLPIVGVTLKPSGEQLRGECPLCKKAGERGFSVTPKLGVFKCFGCGKTGNMFHLVSAVKGVSLKVAGDMIEAHFAVHTPALAPLDYLVYNEHVPFKEEDAQRLGIGYAPKGIMRGKWVLPLRTQDGTLVGYVGFEPGTPIKLPKELKFGGS